MQAEPGRAAGAVLAGALFLATGAITFDVLRGAGPPAQTLATDALLLGALVAVAVIAVRARRAAAAAADLLRRSEARHRSILDGSGEAIIIIDDQATVCTFNGRAERMFGYAAGEIVGSSLERLMTNGARSAHAAYLAEKGVTAMVEAVKLRTTHKGVRKTGEVFTFELTMTEWRDGPRRMFTGAMRDVTERERAAQALLASQARYAELYENSPELLFIYAVESGGGFLLESMNRAAEEYVGYTRSAIVGRTPDQLALPESARRFKRALLACLDTRVSQKDEMPLRTDRGVSSLPVTLSPMQDASGVITRILASSRAEPSALEVRAA